MLSYDNNVSRELCIDILIRKLNEKLKLRNIYNNYCLSRMILWSEVVSTIYISFIVYLKVEVKYYVNCYN